MVDEFTRKYVEQRERLRKQFLSERVGDQELFNEREKLFKPIIDSQKETSKDIQDKIVKNQENLDLMNLRLAEIKTKSKEMLTDFELPSEVQKNKNFESTIKSISVMKSSLGQLTKESNKKRSEVEKGMFKSQQKTLDIYERKIKKLHASEEFIVKSGEEIKNVVEEDQEKILILHHILHQINYVKNFLN